MVSPFHREQEKETRKQHAKAAKRAKLNPDTAQTALDVQKQGHKATALASAGTDSTDAEPTDKREGKMQTQFGKAIQLGNGTGLLRGFHPATLLQALIDGFA